MMTTATTKGDAMGNGVNEAGYQAMLKKTFVLDGTLFIVKHAVRLEDGTWSLTLTDLRGNSERVIKCDE